MVTFVAETLVPLIVVAPKNQVLLPSETATRLLPGRSVVELLDGSLLQPTITMVADMIPMQRIVLACTQSLCLPRHIAIFLSKLSDNLEPQSPLLRREHAKLKKISDEPHRPLPQQGSQLPNCCLPCDLHHQGISQIFAALREEIIPFAVIWSSHIHTLSPRSHPSIFNFQFAAPFRKQSEKAGNRGGPSIPRFD